VATAANGDSVLLGHKNTATKTTTIKDRHGTPLSLIGKKTKPPLTVNSSKMVKNLNAAKVGGFSAAQLRGHASSAELGVKPQDAFESGTTGILVPKLEGTSDAPVFHTVKVISTSTLPAGNYVVTASGFGSNSGCWIDSVLDLSRTEDLFGLGALGSNAPAAGSSVRSFGLTKPAAISLYCYGVSFDDDGFIPVANIAAVPVGPIAHGTHAATTTPAP
jgi:hypothetical protein